MNLPNILIQFNRKFRPSFEEKIAAVPSSYLDPSERIFRLKRNITTGRKAILTIFCSTFLPYWETDTVIRTIGQKAYAGNYLGVWKEVQGYLETYKSDPEWFLAEYLKNHSPEELFGNFLKEAMKEAEYCQRIDITKLTEYSTRVRRKIRRRGYDDKGTLRLPHQNHGRDIPNYLEKEDRRGFINHPLLIKQKNEKRVEERDETTVPPKEVRIT